MHKPVISAAYGRTLNSQKAVREYWESNADVQCHPGDYGMYSSRSELQEIYPGEKFQFRYGKNLTKVMMV